MRGPVLVSAILAATVGQLLVAALVPLARFEGKAFGARLVAYPVAMLVVPVVWLLVARSRPRPGPTPWGAFALLMLPFLVDVTGNTLDLYDRVVWWDDANHAVNWFVLSLGVGLLLDRAAVRPRWALGVLVAGVGALLAVGWELAEWFTFIRHGTELDTAYQDTLGDEVLGCLGAAVAGLVVVRRARRDAVTDPAATRRVVLRTSGITIDSPHPAELATFWAAALGYDERPLWGPFTGVEDPAGRGPYLTFQHGDAGEGARQHLDLYADDPDGEAARLVRLGAERVRRVEEGDTWWWVLRDPDGNAFCVIATRGTTAGDV